MIVVDTSAVLDALTARPVPQDLLARIRGEAELHAPHLIDVEFVNALRRLVRARDLTIDRASEARLDFQTLIITRYPHTPLTESMWELRDNLTAYDAAYVALAEALDVPLVTTDRRLAGASGHSARIELFAQ